jgi:hypothetical protein
VTATYVTLCGTGANVSAGGGTPEYGMVFRDAATGTIDSLAVLGFEYGFDTRAVTGNVFGADDVTMDNSAFWSLMFTPEAADSSDNDGGFDEESILTAGTGNDTEPDPVPFTLEDCQDEGGPTDAVKESDIGAFTGDATWMDELWVDFSPN